MKEQLSFHFTRDEIEQMLGAAIIRKRPDLSGRKFTVHFDGDVSNKFPDLLGGRPMKSATVIIFPENYTDLENRSTIREDPNE